MTRDEYNAKVQEIQAMWGDACKIISWRSNDGKRLQADFSVYWDGHWHTLGIQYDQFTDKTRYVWRDVKEMELRGEFAAALIHS